MQTEKNEVKSKTDVKTETEVKNEPRQKNPKRVAAGKKGAEARWTKHSTEKKESEKQNIERQDQPNKITRETESLRDTQPHIQQPHVNVYEKYIPLCFVGLAGLGVYIYFHWKSSSAEASAKTHAVNIKPVKHTQQNERDPFDF